MAAGRGHSHAHSHSLPFNLGKFGDHSHAHAHSHDEGDKMVAFSHLHADSSVGPGRCCPPHHRHAF
jgi:hypothetical protein